MNGRIGRRRALLESLLDCFSEPTVWVNFDGRKSEACGKKVKGIQTRLKGLLNKMVP